MASVWNGGGLGARLVSGPAPGDLVIVLPDDDASVTETSMYRQRGELLLSYRPRPPIPHWLHSLFDSFHIGAEGRYRYDALPDRWMDGIGDEMGVKRSYTASGTWEVRLGDSPLEETRFELPVPRRARIADSAALA